MLKRTCMRPHKGAVNFFMILYVCFLLNSTVWFFPARYFVIQAELLKLLVPVLLMSNLCKISLRLTSSPAFMALSWAGALCYSRFQWFKPNHSNSWSHAPEPQDSRDLLHGQQIRSKSALTALSDFEHGTLWSQYEMMWYSIIFCSMIQYNIVWHYTVKTSIVWYNMIWYDIFVIHYDLMWCHMIWYAIIWFDLV